MFSISPSLVRTLSLRHSISAKRMTKRVRCSLFLNLRKLKKEIPVVESVEIHILLSDDAQFTVLFSDQSFQPVDFLCQKLNRIVISLQLVNCRLIFRTTLSPLIHFLRFCKYKLLLSITFLLTNISTIIYHFI
jgi:hypothetical protein